MPRILIITVCLAVLLVGEIDTARSQDRQIVKRVTDVDIQFLMSQPPGILVTATGEVPTRGYTEIRLERVHFVSPPADGYQVYRLSAKPPGEQPPRGGMSVSASDAWPFFERDAPWLRGVRIVGEGDGVKSVRINRRVRRNIRNYSEQEIDVLRRGIAVMKGRPPNDPTSWSFQANIHWTFSGSNPLFNQCQHGTSHFLTWHRLYLYHFEQILSEAAGDPHMTLPYWDWSENRALPLAFRNPPYASNALYDNSRFINQGALLPTAIVQDDLITAHAQTSLLGSVGFSSRLEGSPHGAVHVEIGGNMSSVATAANDPIFWLHHCNIDRLWDHWLNAGQGRSNPGSATFMDQTFSFAAVDGTVATRRVGDHLFSSQLGYSYDTTPPPAIPFTPVLMAAAEHTPQDAPAGGHGGAGGHGETDDSYRTIASARALTVPGVEATQEAGEDDLSPSLGLEPHRVQLTTTPDGPQELAAVRAAGAPPSQILVRVEGLQFEEAPAFTYAVYLNLPQNVTDPERRALYRLGTLNLFGIPKTSQVAGAAHAEHELSQTFDATETISRLKSLELWTGEAIEIVLLPLTAAAPPEQAEAYRERLQASAARAKVRYRDVQLLSK